MTRDITEGRSTRAIAVDIGVGTSDIWQNNGDSYDFAIAGIPFLTAINDTRPYERATAQFRKQQFDSQRDPGEQSLSNWWLRSQSSFHAGEGITFFDPLANPYSTTIASNSYRVKESYGVDIWTQGQVTLLKDVSNIHITTKEIDTTAGRPGQTMRTINYGGTDGFLLHDGYDIDRVDSTGTTTHWVDYASGTTDPVYAMCDDGEYAYWVTNDTVSGKLELDKKALTAAATTAPNVMFTKTGVTVARSAMEYVKQRLVLAVNNVVYETFTNATTSTSLTTIYTHPNSSYNFTSITESGTAVYIAGFLGSQSSIYKFTLDTTTGAMPVLTSAITAAEMPVGEVVYKIYTYLGYMIIGTSKGIRVASILSDGSLTYGPLIVETSQPVYDFCARDRFVWCAAGVNTEPGLIRIDLSNEIDTLVFAYGHDIHYDNYAGATTTACAFVGNTNRIAFATAATQVDTLVTNKELTSDVATLTMTGAHGLAVGDIVWVEGVDATFNTGSPYTGETVLSVTTNTFTYARVASNVASTAVTSAYAKVKKIGALYLEEATKLRANGYLETGYIRFNTLEEKHFERITARGNFNVGSMNVQTVDLNRVAYDIIEYNVSIGTPEVRITQPSGAQDALAFRFRLYRSSDDDTLGPTFKGYQLKALPATPRNRIITIPLMNFDSETDKYNMTLGYEGRAFERLTKLEAAEASGDVVTFQDFRTGEMYQCLIEEVKFTVVTPPDKKLTGFGGIISLTIRTV